MLEELSQDLESRVGYRVAYGEAARLAKKATFDHDWGETSRRAPAARPTPSSGKLCGGAATGSTPS
jgi:hypothetical protein